LWCSDRCNETGVLGYCHIFSFGYGALYHFRVELCLLLGGFSIVDNYSRW